MTIMSELDRQEQEILATFEAGEWQSVGEPDRLLELQSYTKAAIAKDRRITSQTSTITARNPTFWKSRVSVLTDLG